MLKEVFYGDFFCYDMYMPSAEALGPTAVETSGVTKELIFGTLNTY